MSRVRRVAASLVLGVSLVAFVATSPPSAYDREQGEVVLSAASPSVRREVGLDVKLQGAFGSETVDFSCGMVWAEGAEPVAVRVTVEDLEAAAGTEPETMQVQSAVGTRYDDGSHTPGPRALVSLPMPCEGDASCRGRYRFTCELPDPPPDRDVAIEWIVSANVRYDPGGLCGTGVESTLDLSSREAGP